MENKKCVEELSCALTDVELLEQSQRLAGLHQKKNDIESRKKTAVADFAAQLKETEGKISLLSNNIRNKKESRNVECRLDYDWKKGKSYLVRLDTGAVVRESVISEFERQQHLDFVKKNKGKTPEPDTTKYMCSSCGNEFDKLKEVDAGEDMPQAEVCPNCESPNWSEV